MSKWLVEDIGDKFNWDFFFDPRGVRYLNARANLTSRVITKLTLSLFQP